jgi:hypothetical protein
MMKKTLLSLTALAAALTLSAQEIRTNYRSEGLTHISTEAEPCQDFTVRVECVGFPDGSTLYQLYIDLRQKTGFTAPKGVKMTATLPGGSVVRADQIGQESATKTRQEDGLYLNRLRYALEESDVQKLFRGVTDLELVTGWDPDDYLRYHFNDDAFSALIKRHCEAMARATETTIDLSAKNVTIVPEPESAAQGDDQMSLSGTVSAISNDRGYIFGMYKLQADGSWDMTAVENDPSEYIAPFSGYLTVTNQLIEGKVEGTTAVEPEPVDPTGINAVDAAADSNASNDVWYDMRGRRLQGEPTQKGIYIKNGKKFVKN